MPQQAQCIGYREGPGMGTDAVVVRPLPARHATPADEAACTWRVEWLAEIVSVLLGTPVTAEQAGARALGLGLATCPEPGRPVELTARAAARLLLAAYRLPALVEAATLSGLRHHLADGRRVFVALPTVAGDGVVCRVEHLEPDGLLLTRGSDGHVECLPADGFAAAWQGFGCPAAIAARSWDELPCVGATFFGGSRGSDGAYFWFTAECETDAAGNILRY